METTVLDIFFGLVLEKSVGNKSPVGSAGRNQEPNRITDREGLCQTCGDDGLEDEGTGVKFKGDDNETRKGALSTGADLDEGSWLSRGVGDGVEQGTIAKSGE